MIKTKDLDVVIFHKEDEEGDLELRYTLRWLKNLPHRDVYIIWHKPEWVQNVKHIPFKDKYTHNAKKDTRENKADNMFDKMMVACRHPDISDTFIYCNNDYYILHPRETLEMYTKGKLQHHRDGYVRKNWETSYSQVLDSTLKLFPNAMAFTVHAPIPFNKKMMLELFDNYYSIFWDDAPDHRYHSYDNLYGNYYKIDAREYRIEVWTADTKIRMDNIRDIPEINKRPFLSTNWHISVNLIKFFDKMGLNEPGKYEKVDES